MKTENDLIDYCGDKNIIIVGNAKSLLNNNYGEFIDSHEVVVRMNMGFPRQEFYDNVGKKTDLWSAAMSNKSWQRIANKQFMNRKFTLWPWRNQKHMIKEIRDRDDVITFYDGGELRRKLKSVPSTGCFLIQYFTKNVKFKNLSIVGFDFFKTPDFWRNIIHSAHHKPQNEEEFILNLVDQFDNVDIIREENVC